jgi:hypothetical protein
MGEAWYVRLGMLLGALIAALIAALMLAMHSCLVCY